MSILIVEDSRPLAANLQRYLELEGYLAVTAHDGGGDCGDREGDD